MGYGPPKPLLRRDLQNEAAVPGATGDGGSAHVGDTFRGHQKGASEEADPEPGPGGSAGRAVRMCA